MNRLITGLVGAAALLLASGSPVSAVDAAAPQPPATGWYLSLGDSLAAGERDDHVAHLQEGYVEHVLPALREEVDPKAKLVNLGCRGETTGTFIAGGVCAFEEGSQLDQAEEFLHAHARNTRLITITLGANNVQRCVRTGAIDLPCVQAGMAQAAQDFAILYGRIRAAAPNVEIIVANYYNPFLAAWLSGPAGQQLAQQSSVLQDALNGLIAANAAAIGADLADVATTFRSDDWSTYPGTNLPTNVVVICQTTYMCTATPNFHANPTGYALMATAITPQIG